MCPYIYTEAARDSEIPSCVLTWMVFLKCTRWLAGWNSWQLDFFFLLLFIHATDRLNPEVTSGALPFQNFITMCLGIIYHQTDHIAQNAVKIVGNVQGCV